jgi:hypothetical protein
MSVNFYAGSWGERSLKKFAPLTMETSFLNPMVMLTMSYIKKV